MISKVNANKFDIMAGRTDLSYSDEGDWVIRYSLMTWIGKRSIIFLMDNL
jgi:hypothetical protein